MNEKLPEIPCTFGSSFYGPFLDFRADRLLVISTYEDGQVNGIKYTEIQRVEIKPTKYFLGLRIAHTILKLCKTNKDYYSAPTPIKCEISFFDLNDWPVILKLIHRYAPQAQFDNWAMRVMNAVSGKEIQNFKI